MNLDLRHTLKFKEILLGIILSLITIPAHAGIDHYKNILIGERASGMGGAFLAIADDPSGLYYNPAGMIYVPNKTLSGSANTFHYSSVKYKGAVQNIEHWTRSSTTLKPNFFGMVKQMNPKLSVGLSYVVPDASVEHQNQVFNDVGDIHSFIISHHLEDTTTYVGPSVAYKINETLSVGMTLYYFYRDYRLQSNQLVYDEGPTFNEWITIDHQQFNAGISPKIGIIWSPLEKLSIGATLKKDTVLSSTYINQRNELTTAEVPTADPINSYSSHHDNTIKFPYQFSVGVAYFPSPYFLVSADIDYLPKVNSSKVDVINFSTGLEYYLNEKNALRAGLFSNFSNIPKPTASTSGLSKIDMYGISLGYSLYGAGSSLTTSLIYSTGSGKSQIYGDATILSYEQTDLTLMIAASFGL